MKARPQPSKNDSTLRGAKISHRQLQIALAVPDVVLQRERQIDGGAMLRNEAFPLGSAPRNAAKDATVLFERHLEVTVLHTPRPIDDLDTARPEDRAGIAGAKRRQRREFRNDLLVDRPERQ